MTAQALNAETYEVALNMLAEPERTLHMQRGKQLTFLPDRCEPRTARCMPASLHALRHLRVRWHHMYGLGCCRDVSQDIATPVEWVKGLPLEALDTSEGRTEVGGSQ